MKKCFYLLTYTFMEQYVTFYIKSQGWTTLTTMVTLSILLHYVVCEQNNPSQLFLNSKNDWHGACHLYFCINIFQAPIFDSSPNYYLTYNLPFRSLSILIWIFWLKITAKEKEKSTSKKKEYIWSAKIV